MSATDIWQCPACQLAEALTGRAPFYCYGDTEPGRAVHPGRKLAMIRIARDGQVPAWVAAQWRDRYICEGCGKRPPDSEWAGTGEMLCWDCIGRRQQAQAHRFRD